MTQSVELTLDADTDARVRDQWAVLAAAGLPTEQRVQPSPSHRPHVTLFAGPAIAPEADARLAALVDRLDLRLRIGSVLLFGPRRGQVVVVRSVVPSRELLDLQAAVAACCGADPQGQFGPGRWSPHVTLARRAPTASLGAMLSALSDLGELDARSRDCRRWDSDRRLTWSLCGPPADG